MCMFVQTTTGNLILKCISLGFIFTFIGVVTSGAPSPLLGYNISMAYVPRTLSDTGTKVNIKVRKHIVPAEIVKIPFISTNYFK